MISNLLEEIRKKEATMSQTENELERIQLQASINRLKEEVQSIERNAKKPLLDRKHTEAVS
jgi:flagellin-like hook-associated protein FlgL